MIKTSDNSRTKKTAIPSWLAALLIGLFIPLTSNADAIYYVGDTSDVVDATTDCLNSLNATCSLREAINDLNAAGAGTYAINLPTGTITITGSSANDTNTTGDYDLTSTAAQTVTINGQGAASTTISGGSIDRIFHITSAAGPVNVTFSNLTLTSGTNSGHYGGCVFSVGSNLTFTNATVTNCSANVANKFGGAVYTDATSTVTVNDSTFSNNSATSSGGAIAAGYVVVNGNSVFSGNASSAGSGGAIYAIGATGDNVTITDTTGTSTFTANVAVSHGGAIYAATTVTITGATFGGSAPNKNYTTSAGKFGGAVYSAGATGTSTYTSNTITFNTTTTSGGGIASNADIAINGGTISNNGIGSGVGGGVYAVGTLTLDGTITVNSNTGWGNGGGLYSGGALTINTGANITVDGNTTATSGGHGAGIYSNSTLTINAGTTTTVTNNNASGSGGYGGGIYAAGALTIDGTTTVNGNLTNTSGGSGGGIYAASTLTINSGAITTVNNNFGGSSSGGGITAIGLLTINSGTTTIDTNTTSGHGGGIYAGAGGATINNATITNNVSTNTSGKGAGIAFNADLTVNNSTVSNNTASGGTSVGGGISDIGAHTLTINNSTVSNNSAGAGGGVYAGTAAIINGSTFNGNSAVRSGFNGAGAVYAPSITTTDSSFTGNSSLFKGGALYATTGSISVTSSTFTSNTATNNGGALYTNSAAGSITIVNSAFNSNSSSTSGGAVLSLGGLSVTGSTFTANSATLLGGALYNTGAVGNFYSANTFTGNYVTTGSSTNAGGCIYTNQALTINDAGSVFKNNYGNGSGGCIWVSGALNINGATTFDGNYSTTTAGGGAVIAGGGGSMTDVTFVNNHANDYGGAFFPTVAYTINNTTFEGNYLTASTGGGAALYLKAAAYAVTVNNSTFSGNYIQASTGQGAAIFTNTGASVLAYNSTFYNNTSSGTTQALRSVTGGNIKLYNSIVAHPSANANLCSSTPGVGNNNVEFNNTGTACTAATGRITTDPLLSALAYNGGSTKTMALQSTSSSAYDASGASATASDQRGILAIGTRDVGAYEYSGVASDTAPPSPVADLATGAATSSTMPLTWTAPGDDYNVGTATTYDVRYSTSPITEGTWATATQATGEPAPSVAGTAENFTVTGLSSSTTYYFAIKTSDEVPNTSPISNVVSATTLAGGGITISGTLYSDEGVTVIATGPTVRLIANGSSVGTAIANGSGVYSITASVNAGDAIIAYIDSNGGPMGNAVTVSNGANLTGLDIYTDRVITRQDNGGSLTNANMSTALGAYSDSDILYSVAGGNLTSNGANTELFVWTGHTFVPGGTITTTHMDINGTLDAAANAINVAGNWDATGGTFTSTGTVTFDAVSGTNTIIPGGVDANHDFQNIVVNDAAGTATFQLGGDIKAVGNFTITDGIFDTSISNYAVTVSGSFAQPGGQVNGNASTFTIAGNFEANGTDSGTGFNSASMVFNGTGSTIIYNNLASWWSDGFNNLTVGQAGVTDTLNTWLTVRNMLTVGTGGLTGTATLALTAPGVSTTFDAASTLSVGTLMFVKFGGTQNIVPLTNGYDCNVSVAGGSSLTVTQTGNITLNAGKSLQVTGDNQASRALTYNTGGFNLTVGGDITLGAGSDSATKTLNITNSAVSVTGNLTIKSGTNVLTATNSTVTFNNTSILSDTSTGGPQQFNSVVLNGTSLTLGSSAKMDNLTVTAGTMDLGASGYILELTGTGTPLNNSGTFTAGTSTVKYSGTTVATNITTLPYSSLELAPTAATTYSLTGHLTGGNALTGSLTIGANATLDTTITNYNITLAGNWSNSGTFTANSGTVTLNGTAQAINGSTTFFNLTKSVAAADTLTFEALKTTTINGTVTLNGAAGQLLTLASSTGSSIWGFVVNAGAVKAISYVSVSWSDASGSDATQKPIAPSNSTDGGNTTDWFVAPSISVVKSSTLVSDPVNGITNPLHIPGAIINYHILTTNSGTGSPDANTVVITDALDSTTLEYDVATGVTFTANTSGLSLGTVSYSHTSTPTTYTYTPTGPYDPNVAGIKITTTGTFATGGANFTIDFQVRVK